MHILINGSFWTQPNVGSGQYLHGLLRWLPLIAPQHQYTLLLPARNGKGAAAPPGVETLLLRTPFDAWNRNLAKIWFEQISIPQTAQIISQHITHKTILHVPYFAPPLYSNLPVVTTILDVIPILLPEYRGGLHIRTYMQIVCRAAQYANHIITLSRHSQRDITAQLGIAPQHITPILLAAAERYVPCKAAKTEVTQRYGLHSPFIYYVGGLDVRKNVQVLVHAMSLLRKQGQIPAPLVIAGRALGKNQQLFPDIDTLIQRLHMQDIIQRLDVPHADGPLLYQSCSVFVFPSRYEGFGLPPLEAMACGAPVIASNASSVPEVVGDAALLVDPDDIPGWANTIHRLLNDASLRTVLRTRGLAQAARFSWRRVAEETIHVYEQM